MPNRSRRCGSRSRAEARSAASSSIGPVPESQERVYARVSNAWAATTSRPDGTFELGGLRTTSDRASFCVVHPGFAPFWAGKREEEDARTTLDDQEVRIVLDQGRTVELQLVDGENGSFVAGPATLEVERVSSFVDAPVGAATREQSHDLVQGRLVAERLGSFVRVLWITCPGYDPLRLDLGAAAVGTGEVVRLRRSLRWELELVDAATGMPILGGSLVIGIDTSPSPELPSAVAVSVDGSGTPRSVHGNRITIDSAWLRWQGRWTLQVSAPGFTPWTRETSAEEMRAGPAVLRVDLERLD